MKSDTPLDYAVFNLSPKRSRCELFVTGDGATEKLASGLLKPFATHLKVAEEKVALAVQSIKLEAEKSHNAEVWFTRGTLERFVRFVSTPEVLELVNTFDVEMSQLEAARRIYSQGVGDPHSNPSGGDGISTSAAADATKKELLRAIDVRLDTLKQDLTAACARASSAGFNPDTVSGLQHFANRFGAHRLSEACTKFLATWQRRPDLITWTPGGDERAVRSSTGSDMSLDDPTVPEPDTAPNQQFSANENDAEKSKREEDSPTESSSSSIQKSQPGRRLSVQDRINLFENKQKESSGGKPKPPELRRLNSDVSSGPGPAVLRRWSGASDMSIDVAGGEKKDCSESPSSVSPVSSVSLGKRNAFSDLNQKEQGHEARDNLNEQGEGNEGEDSREKQKILPLKGFSDRDDVSRTFGGKVGDVASESVFVNRGEDVQQRDQRMSQPQVRRSQGHFRSLSGQLEGGFGMKFREFQDKDTEGDQLAAKEEDSGAQRMKFQRPIPSQGGREESGSFPKSSKPISLGTKVIENEDSFGTPGEQVQRVRNSKGNQELNDELKMKANELEKLFAEHKLRVPGDQSSSARRGRPADSYTEQPVNSSQYRNLAAPDMSPIQLPERSTVGEPSGSSSNMNFSTPPMKTVDNRDYGKIRRSNSSDHGFVYDTRGKFYETYMQKRNAKLSEEWGSNRAEKEAKMKAMRDNLEQSRAELKAKFSDGDNSVSSARRRAEKLRSFNARSSWKREQLIDSMRSEEDEDLSDQKSFGQDRSFNEAYFGDSGSRSSQSKKSLPARNMLSSTPRGTAAPVPRSSVKSSNLGSGRRKPQAENPLAQSVPNFSDFRKENTKPSSGVSKMTTRSQVRNYSRSKSASEEIPLFKDEKTRRHQSGRKNSANPAEFKDASPMNSGDFVTGTVKFNKEQTEPIMYDAYTKHADSKPFLRKGNGIGPGAGASIAKLKASIAPETRDEEEFDELPFDAEDSIVKEEDEEGLATVAVEDCDDMDIEKPSGESDKSDNSGSENGDSVRSLSQVDPASVAELSAPVPSSFHLIGSLQGSPGESPIAWNSRMHHPFSYQHESSDIDASVDSPMGSPASWNSHSLTQTDSDAARMRKKWGSAQKPILVSHSSQTQSRKDMTKGFKRLLKFGRKKSGTESFVDWISATTSEGDDDTEDGRDPASRSSEDLRKSRMGFSQGHPSDDGYNDIQDLCSSIPAPPANFKLREDHISGSSLKAPRSFFSLSSFRSKGSDSKPR